MHNFKELLIWKKSIELATEIYRITKTFPSDEKFGLISQMRRSAVSISSNIAEGAGRQSDKDFNHFLNISFGSLHELETQLIISKNLKYLDEIEFTNLSFKNHEIQKMTFSLKKTLKIN